MLVLFWGLSILDENTCRAPAPQLSLPSSPAFHNPVPFITFLLLYNCLLLYCLLTREGLFISNTCRSINYSSSPYADLTISIAQTAVKSAAFYSITLSYNPFLFSTSFHQTICSFHPSSSFLYPSPPIPIPLYYIPLPLTTSLSPYSIPRPYYIYTSPHFPLLPGPSLQYLPLPKYACLMRLKYLKRLLQCRQAVTSILPSTLSDSHEIFFYSPVYSWPISAHLLTVASGYSYKRDDYVQSLSLPLRPTSVLAAILIGWKCAGHTPASRNCTKLADIISTNSFHRWQLTNSQRWHQLEK